MSSHTKSLVAARCAPQQIGPVVTCLDDVAESEIQWLWPGYIPLGHITLLVGCLSEGKSPLACEMAARVTVGAPWPDGSPCPSGSVIIASSRNPGDTIHEALKEYNADLRRVHPVSAVRTTGADGNPQWVPFRIDDVSGLDRAIKSVPDCRLIVIDHIESFIGCHSANRFRRSLTLVADFAKRHGTAVLAITYGLRNIKSIINAAKVGYGINSFAFAVWHVYHDTRNRRRRLLLPGKNSLATKRNGLAFTINFESPTIVWEREPVATNDNSSPTSRR